jgi:site-specific recombinase XerD
VASSGKVIACEVRRRSWRIQQLQNISNLFARYTLEAGLPEHLRHEHCLKHSCATHLLAKGADVIVVKDWLGHRDIRSTMEYAQIRNAQRDAAAKVYLQG